MSDSGDEEFATLKPSLRRAIDTAFLKLSRRARSKHATQPRRKKPRLESPESGEEGGGFVKDDQDEQGSEDEQDGIPLSMVPIGLQMLDLPPDDEDVISVFRNAATGWESRPGVPRRRGSGSDDEVLIDKDVGLSVSRQDWRAVCAVLLGQKEDVSEEERPKQETKKRTWKVGAKDKQDREQPERRRKIRAKRGGGFLVEDGGGGSDDEQGGFLPASDEEMEDAQDGSDSDRYSDDNDASSVSEFGAPTQPKATRSRTKKNDSDVDMDVDDNWENDMPRSLTVRQLREAKLAFALFFPGVDANDPSLNARRLGMKEVEEAAKTLKENLSSNDIKEMLSMFSSAPDGSIGLEEFGRMAVMARLI
ncbi:hypothetical protein OPQ81_001041 [Rhizoctonia solani]|nr:hypothetical protein OPQ81_001041 [Rhizoctonia solani]